MNRERLFAELPAPVATWLAAEPDTSPLWDELGRAIVVRLGRQLLALEGWNRPARARFLANCQSPALRAILPTLPVRQWGANTVAGPLCAHFQIFGAERDLRDRLGRFCQSHVDLPRAG